MKKSMAFVFAVGLSSAVLAAGQGTPASAGQTTQPTASQPSASQPSASQPSANQQTVTVTGCVQRSETASATSPNTPPAADSARAATGSFILANVASPSMAKGGSTTGGATPTSSANTGTATSGTSGTAATRSYTLVEKTAGELTPHVGHQVEITGTVANAAGAGAAKPGETSSPNTPASGMSGSMNQRLQVSSIKMVSATCSAAPSTNR